MVGHGDAREVALWVQTTGPAEVEFRYRDMARPERTYRTSAVRTSVESAFIARASADSVAPGRRYAYEIWLDGRPVARPYALTFQTPPLWRGRSDPPPLRVAVGSCFYVNDPLWDRPGEPYGGEYGILSAIVERRPDLMLWLGDNVYLRDGDWGSREGVLYRYAHTRSLPELQPLLGSVHHYAIWDDHDYGPNNSDRSFAGKPWSREAFSLFWPNPQSGVEDLGGVTTTFEWGDVQFFLLDNRWDRSPNDRKTGGRVILGERQMEWLVDALASSRATFKIVAIGGQVLNPLAYFENYASYGEERAALLAAIEKEGIAGVVFLSGDRHRGELTRLERPGSYPLYDLTVSPLTAGVYAEEEPNTLRVPGTFVAERHFATLEFDGPADDRRLTMTVYGSDGASRWSRTIHATELR